MDRRNTPLRRRNSEQNQRGRHVWLYAVGSGRFLTGSNKTLRVSESHTVTLSFIVKLSTVFKELELETQNRQEGQRNCMCKAWGYGRIQLFTAGSGQLGTGTQDLSE